MRARGEQGARMWSCGIAECHTPSPVCACPLGLRRIPPERRAGRSGRSGRPRIWPSIWPALASREARAHWCRHHTCRSRAGARTRGAGAVPARRMTTCPASCPPCLSAVPGRLLRRPDVRLGRSASVGRIRAPTAECSLPTTSLCSQCAQPDSWILVGSAPPDVHKPCSIACACASCLQCALCSQHGRLGRLAPRARR